MDEQHEKDKEHPAVEFKTPGFKGSFSTQAFWMLLQFCWKDRRLVVWTVCYALIVVATCFAVSLLWK
jgi:hypothetical protein